MGCGKLKSRLIDARDLTARISKFQEEIKGEGLDRAEEDLSGVTEQVEAVEEKIGRLDRARKREQYERGHRALARLKESLSELERLAIYTEEDEREWRDGERDLARLLEEENTLQNALANKITAYEQVKKKYTEERNNFRILEKRKKKLDEEIRPEIKNYQEKKEELALQKSKKQF